MEKDIQVAWQEMKEADASLLFAVERGSKYSALVGRIVKFLKSKAKKKKSLVLKIDGKISKGMLGALNKMLRHLKKKYPHKLRQNAKRQVIGVFKK